MKKIVLLFCCSLSVCILSAQETYKGYVEKIESIKNELLNIETARETKKRDEKAEIEKEYNQKISEIETEKYDFFWSDEDINKAKTEKKNEAISNRDKRLSTQIKNIDVEYDAKRASSETELNNTIKSFTSKEFLIENCDLTVGEFKKNEKPPYWDFKVTSKSEELGYSHSDKIYLQGVDIAKEAPEIEYNKRDYKAVLTYIVVQEKDLFRKKISKIEIKDKRNAVIRSYNISEFENEKPVVKLQNPENGTQKVDKAKTASNGTASNQYKQVWVDTTSDGHYVFEVISWTAGICAEGAGIGLLTGGLICDDTSMAIAGGCCMGGGVLLMLCLALPLSCTHSGHYEQKLVSEIQSNPVLKHVAFTPTSIGITFDF